MSSGTAAVDFIFAAAISLAKEGAIDETSGEPATAARQYSEALLLLEAILRDGGGGREASRHVLEYREMILDRLRALQ
jgi:hypothetical protein